MPLTPIIPAIRRDAFDDPAWCFDLKLDGFRGIADMIHRRIVSRNGNRMHRFESVLDDLPTGYVFDGEIVALDNDGRPRFNDLLEDSQPGLFAEGRPGRVVRAAERVMPRNGATIFNDLIGKLDMLRIECQKYRLPLGREKTNA